MDRRTFLSSIAAAAASTGLGAESVQSTVNAPQTTGNSPQKAPQNAPNILIFMPDQQCGDTVLPNHPVIKPNLDKFRAESVTFTHAHCPAPHCCPSRASFMSGLYPSEHGVYNNVTTDTAIHPNPYPGTPFWGTQLRDAGYAMGYSGKLHVGRNITPEDCGFQNLNKTGQDSLKANEDRKAAAWKSSRNDPSDPAHRVAGNILRPMWNNNQLYKTLADDQFEHMGDTRVVNTGVDAIRRYSQDKSKPWCLMVSNSGAHDPYNAPKRFVDMYDINKIPLPPSFKDTLDDKPRVYQRQRYEYWSQLSDEETRDAIRHYWALCTMQDELFGRLLKALEESGQAENTIVLYVSDHGDYTGAHGLWYKGVPSFREAYSIPYVIRWPKGVTQPGRTVDAFIDQVDFGPTVLEACGLTPAKKLSGHSVMPFLRNETPSHWRKAFCSQMNGVELYYTQRIVMTHEWKYVYNGFDYDELYDLKADPHEMRNLAFPDLAKKRADVLAGHGLEKDAHVPWPSLEPRLEAARKDLLTTMWDFASAHHDIIHNPYGTVALAPWGPGVGNVFGASED